ncbi:MAG: pyridoxamine 5'-phosphate oxidase family protein [Candidatus Tectomicrobia bacterium]|nr:pyridoxamine 5'-phosphate oxidase family protein [Candidatus Tectomicrobia bacterium]
MASWAEFKEQAPDLAAAGWRLLVGADGVAIGFLATVASDGRPRMAPVCPIFANGNIYLSVGSKTPKRNDLARNRRYVLHAFLGKDDEEFQISGQAIEVTDPEERVAVHRAIKFGAYNTEDPIFLLDVERCLWAIWENVGQPNTRPIRKHWRV